MFRKYQDIGLIFKVKSKEYWGGIAVGKNKEWKNRKRKWGFIKENTWKRKVVQKLSRGKSN